MHLRDLRVLVVDDSSRMREIVRTLLQGFGLSRPEEVGSAEACLDRLRLRPWHLVIVDCDIGTDNGVELARMVRQDKSHPNQTVPMIMLTGRGDAKTVFAARDAGIDEFLAKPVSAVALAARINAALTRRREFTAAPGYLGPDRRRRRGEYQGPERRTRDRA